MRWHPAPLNWHHSYMINAFYKLSFSLCFTVITLASCSGQPLDLINTDNRKQAESNVSGDEQVYYLDLNNPSIQPIDSNQKAPEAARFVKVEVVEIVNPRNLPVAFQVHYQTRTNEKLYLGSFGLYPSDNPGKFIVPTKGKLKNEGAIVLSLVKPENLGAGDTIKVGVKRIQLVTE